MQPEYAFIRAYFATNFFCFRVFRINTKTGKMTLLTNKAFKNNLKKFRQEVLQGHSEA